MNCFKPLLIFCCCFFSALSGQELPIYEELTPTSKENHTSIYSSNSRIDSLLIFAFNYLDKPYRGGSSGPNSFDCSGFTSFVYGHFGYKLERSSADQTKNGIEIPKRNLQPGDLVFYKGRNAKASRIGHVGIVATVKDDGSFTFIHAAVSTGVSHDNSTGNYYSRRYVTARRIIGAENVSPIIRENNCNNNPEPIETETATDTIPFSTTPTHKTIIHAVEKGQTLFSIAKKYSCSVQQLKKWNQLNSTSLYIGQELKIETNNQPINEENITSEETKPQITHRVRKGETLYQIAKNYHCSVTDIRNWNNLNSNNIHPKQLLKIGENNSQIPSKKSSYHKVKAGETLSNIAEKYNCSLKQLKQKNGLRTSRISIGQRLKIPTD